MTLNRLTWILSFFLCLAISLTSNPELHAQTSVNESFNREFHDWYRAVQNDPVDTLLWNADRFPNYTDISLSKADFEKSENSLCDAYVYFLSKQYPQKKYAYSILSDTTTNILWGLPINRGKFISHESKSFEIDIYPIFGKEWGEGNTENFHFIRHNYQGFESFGKYKNNLSFYIRVVDHQAKIPISPSAARITIPGYGFVKQDKPGVLDFNDVVSEFIYSGEYGDLIFGKSTPNWSINGESTILSSQVSAYPNIRWRIEFDYNFEYESIWGELTHFEPRNIDTTTQRKSIAAHRLIYKPNNNFRFSIFESIIYSGRSFEPIYHIPFIFMRGAEHFTGSPDNANLGFGVEWIPSNQWYFGYQFLIDDVTTSRVFDKINNNKFASLLGIAKYGELFNSTYSSKLTIAYVTAPTYLHRNDLNEYYHYGDLLGIDTHKGNVNFKLDNQFRINNLLGLGLEFGNWKQKDIYYFYENDSNQQIVFQSKFSLRFSFLDAVLIAPSVIIYSGEIKEQHLIINFKI